MPHRGRSLGLIFHSVPQVPFDAFSKLVGKPVELFDPEGTVLAERNHLEEVFLRIGVHEEISVFRHRHRPDSVTTTLAKSKDVTARQCVRYMGLHAILKDLAPEYEFHFVVNVD